MDYIRFNSTIGEIDIRRIYIYRYKALFVNDLSGLRINPDSTVVQRSYNSMICFDNGPSVNNQILKIVTMFIKPF